jgi:hypothetical protein|tara:strand:- start:818 stop:1156 length:339 start_codon:yes stop_codon:yes gene_type:complete
MAKYYHATSEGNIPFTAEEETARDAEIKAFQDDLPNRKLARIRKIRNEKLAETDFYALADQVMSDEMKTYRKNLRDITTNYSQSDYDDLLNRVSDKTLSNFGELTHSVWSKP